MQGIGSLCRCPFVVTKYKADAMKSTPAPSLEYEARLWEAGHRHVAGLDEAGRGALAGPVVAAAVVLPPQSPLDGIWARVRDSKQLKPAERAALAAEIRRAAQAWAVAAVPAAEIDQMGIGPATRLAMYRALATLAVPPDYLLIDWVKLRQVNIPQESLPRADERIVTVAAASILAKVHRDELLVELDRQFPHYGFAAHKGYGTRSHREALARHGPCPVHRFSFAPLARPATFFPDPRPGQEP